MLAVARNLTAKQYSLNLPKYAVQGRGATKPPTPESPPTETNVCSLSCHYTVLLLGGVTLGHLAL